MDTDTPSNHTVEAEPLPDDLNMFQKGSITRTGRPYELLLSRREVPERIQDRATFALGYIMERSDKRKSQHTICMATPLWVSDTINRSSCPLGITDQWRSQACVNALRMIHTRTSPSQTYDPSEKDMKSWDGRTSSTRYRDQAKDLGVSKDASRRIGYLIERMETYVQVKSTLTMAGYNGRPYSPRDIRLAKVLSVV